MASPRPPLPRSADGRIDLGVLVERLHRARERLEPYLRRTPTLFSYTFTESAGCEVHLKLENLQRTGSFKVRGALNRILGLGDEERDRGLVAASAGNHAQGVALAAQLTGCSATIVMPEATSLVKVRSTEGYGGRVVLRGETWDESQAHAREIAAREGRTLVHPFDDLDVVLGQGTVALEVLEAVPEVRELVVCVGGGGLLAGCAIAVRGTRPEVRLVGAQAEGADALVRSFETGTLVRDDAPRTLAEGIRVGSPGQLTFEVIAELVDRCVRVSEAQIARAVVETMQKSRVVAEAAGVAGIAALSHPDVAREGPVCAIVSGGNIDLNQLARFIESGLAEAGFTHLLRLRVQDLPGQLHRITSVLAESKTNVLYVQHYRAGWKVPVGYVDVEILLETRHAGQGPEVEGRLAGLGYEVR